MTRNIFIILFLLVTVQLSALDMPKFSTAGFYELPNTGREVYSMNLAWRFMKGDVEGKPYSIDYNDSDWQVVSVPHGLEYLPSEASGCANYQGIAWYRKRFTPDERLKGKQLFIHFEAIMGKSEVYVNGKLLKEYYGGYLPVIVDVTNVLKWGEENVIAVKADNGDDPLYPVGKAQNMLDFTYFGGIYRDCWLIAHNDVFITNANYENEVAGGGLFISYADVSEKSAVVNLKAHIRNNSKKNERVSISFELKNKEGKVVQQALKKVSVGKGKASYAITSMKVKTPLLWSPDSPNLYHLDVKVKDDRGTVIDGYRQRVGIRSIEFKQTDGLWINGKRYDGKLMGTNRHQDFAVLGNALPNSMQWRDAKKLRDAGMKVIRTHYVIDPAFMDACDELGLFALVEVPGWQFWNKEPIFGERVYSDIRNMIRIHRNHASLFFWEPILNETHYPDEFARKALDICEEEYPYPYSIAACDHGAAGDHYYSLLLRPIESKLRTDKTYFIREWGDNVDDWSSHNSPSRASRAWGETPMLIQAQGYTNPSYPYTCYETLYQTTRQHIGGCLWHSFDHQRGYHPDPFYGGIMDAFRQPKYSYYMFQAQRSPQKSDLIAETGPMVYIAHAMTPFSPKDVTVYSNCDEVRLTVFKEGKQYHFKKEKREKGMPSPVITFKDAYDFMQDKALSRKRKQADVYMFAEGLIDGKVVATHRVSPARRPSRLLLWVDNEGMQMEANGSDIVTVVAAVADENGNIKRLNNYFVRFEIEGEGTILGDEDIMANPRPVQWGTAPVLVKSTTRPGKIKVRASVLVEGTQMPASETIEIETYPATVPLIFDEAEENAMGKIVRKKTTGKTEDEDCAREVKRLQMELNQYKLKEVEQQQTDFGEKR